LSLNLSRLSDYDIGSDFEDGTNPTGPRDMDCEQTQERAWSAPPPGKNVVRVLRDGSTKTPGQLPGMTNGNLMRISVCSDTEEDGDQALGQVIRLLRPASARLASVCGHPSQEKMLFPELTFNEVDAVSAGKMDSVEAAVTAVTAVTMDGPRFDDDDCPVVTRIEIDGNWFNKKTRAVIEWKGVSFKRKMADFKWLSKMLQLNSTDDRVAPEYPNEIPSTLWRTGYLKRRTKELNLYLMHCHSLPWIRRYKAYRDIFLESDKKAWKRKRDYFDRNMMRRIKEKQLTYRPDLDEISYSDDDSSEDEDIMY